MKKVDLILHNSTIYTINNTKATTEALAIKNGKIIAIGSNKAIVEQYHANTIHNLGKKYVYPGFYDAHCHFLRYALMQNELQLFDSTSLNDLVERTKAYHHKKPHLTAIIGKGWDDTKWTDDSKPHKAILDYYFPNIPVLLLRVDMHAALVNQKALDLAGITLDSFIEGGKVLQENGEASGILIDNAISVVSAILPQPSLADLSAALVKAQHHCFAVGLTTLNEALIEQEEIALIDELQKSNELKLRFYMMINSTPANRAHYFKHGLYKTDHLNARCFKYFSDGALGSRGAWLLAPYTDAPDNYGLPLLDKPVFTAECAEYLQHGFQVATHAIGDAANKFVLDAYSAVLPPNNPHRWRVEHAQILQTSDLARFKQYNITPSIQATHATSDCPWIVKRLGENRLKKGYRFKELLDQNGYVAAGSDFPVEQINPLLGFYAAVVRKNTDGYPSGGFQMDNALSRWEALQAMTIWAAYSNFEEHERGSLAPNKFADLVVLDQDIMTIADEEILNTKVLQTYIGGELVYEKPKYTAS